jgi:hypothetical protein
MTVGVGNVREWRGEDVLDENGDKIGSLEAVYVDTETDEPAFATVKVRGLIGAGGWCSYPSPGPASVRGTCASPI